MAKEFRVSEKVGEAGLILGALGVIGFIGIIWLLIYGNLSGNLGFGQDTASFVNQTINLTDAGNTPAGASGRINGLISNSSIIMINNSNGIVIGSGNFSTNGVLIFNAGQIVNSSNVNVSYDVSFDSSGKIDTENVITNLTGGFNTFFTFSNTFFTIAAIVLLIFMF
ncbi:hypothetical protein LCGC14_1704350, partial [marine sediment metagenome]